MRLVECVPNFSEGRNRKVIDAIAEAIQSVEGVALLDVDPGKSTNRTVMTFVGAPEAVLAAAFDGIARAAALIDMRTHRGAHPRIGATDVCPFVPVSGVTMPECAELARQLGKRVGDELGIPVYLYAQAAAVPERRLLADIRAGEYEGLAGRMQAGFAPDFGPGEFNARAGATVIGARPFLIAYNVNLNTRSQKLAHEIALSIREAGRARRDAAGAVVKDASGKTVKEPGILKACQAVGWYIEEYRRAQVSINLLDYKVTSIHEAFDECVRQAEQRGLRVTGSEIVGLTPLEPLLMAGRHYLARQGRCVGVPESEVIECAIQSLGLSELSKFDPQARIIDYRVAEDKSRKLLRNMTLAQFADELSSDSPAPGGGSVAALCGALSAALSSMVANLTHGKKGFEASRAAMDDVAVRAQALKASFLRLVDTDTEAFNRVMEALRMPKNSPAEQAARAQALQAASREATLVPLEVLGQTVAALDLAAVLVEKGNPNSVSDSGVAGLTAHAAAEGAYYNVLINLPSLEDQGFRQETLQKAETLVAEIARRAEQLRESVLGKLEASESGQR
jgi:glutamate formiminotransferase / formiminotetrahydrofolate cyclodeaminase